MSLQHRIEENLKHNYIVNFSVITFYLLANSFRAEHTILPLFISQLTASPIAIGALSAIVSSGTLLPQLFTANWVQRTPVKKNIQVKIGFFAERLPLICLVLAAWMAFYSKTAALYFGMFCIAWFVIGSGMTMVAWQDMIAKLFPTRTRGRFMGTTFFVGTGAGVLGTIGAAWALDNYPFPINFMITFGFAAVFIVISWVFLTMTKEPPDPPNTSTSDKIIDWAKLVQVFKEDDNYRRYIYSAVITALGKMAVGFLTVYALKNWRIPNSMVGLYTTFLIGGQAAGNLVFGWLADRFGHKLSLEITILLNTASLVIAILAKSPQVFYVVFALQGIFLATSFLSGTNIIFEFCDPDVRPTYIGLSNTVIGIVAGLGPILGGLIVGWLNYTWLFVIAAVLSLIGFGTLQFLVFEPRSNTA
jgi:MFS family permease